MTVKKEKYFATLLIKYLLEIERRELHLRYGYESMFKFLTRELFYSDAEAYVRVNAMKLAKADPVVQEKMSQGKLSLTAASEIQKLIKEERRGGPEEINLKNIISQVEGKSVSESKDILDKMRTTPRAKKFKVELDEETWKKLQEIKKAQGSTSSEECLIKNLVDEKLSKLEKNKEKETKRSASITEKTEATEVTEAKTKAPKISGSGTRYIPKRTKKHLLADADHRCQYVSPESGKRCECTKDLTVEHCFPYALGGRNDISNLKILCRCHNMLAAKEVYGSAKITQSINANTAAMANFSS